MSSAFQGIIMALAIVAYSAYYYYTKVVVPANAEKEAKALEEKKKKAAAEKEAAAEEKKQAKPVAVDKKPKKKVKKTDHPRFVRRFGGHLDFINDMSLSPNGEWLATAGMDGQLRVTHVEQKLKNKSAQDMHLTTGIRYSRDEEKLGSFKPSLSKVAWAPDNRTLVGATVHSAELAFFRVRKMKDAPAGTKFPFELAELPKRRFDTKTKVTGTMGSCLVDYTHSNYLLVLTESDDLTHGHVTVAWDGTNGDSVGKGNLGASSVKKTDSSSTPTIRISTDGRFLCRGGIDGATKQVKLFEIVKKKVKGEVDPVFDKIASKSAMTLVVNEKVADVCFSPRNNSGNSDMAIVCCVDGLIQVWSLDVEYRQREDPKLLCSFQIPTSVGMMYASSSPTSNRIAVVTTNSDLHVLTYSEEKVTLDFSIEEAHEELVADVQFCPAGGNVVYTRGEESKHVYSWSTSEKP